MTTNKIFDEIFASDLSDRAASFKISFKNAMTSYVSNPANVVHVRHLNNQYWDMVYFITRKNLTVTKNMELVFSESEKLAIDFGYVSDELIFDGVAPDKNLFAPLKPEKNSCSLSFFSVTSWICYYLQDFIGVNKIKKLEAQYDGLLNLIENLRTEKKSAIESKEDLSESFFSNAPKNVKSEDLEKIKLINNEIDALLEKFGVFRSRIQNEMPLKPDERVEYVNYENIINKKREERKKVLRQYINISGEYLFNLSAAEDELVRKEGELFELVSKIGRNKIEIEEFTRSKKELSFEDIDAFLKDKILELKNIIEIIFRNNKIDPLIFLTRPPVTDIAGKVCEIFEKVIGRDPCFFKNKKVKSCGYPQFVFVPGRGKSDYDYRANAFVIPIFPIKDYFDSVINAMALYRWECDEDCRLKNAFSMLKANRYYTSAPMLQNVFMKNYAACMQKNEMPAEFDFEMREWFLNYITSTEEQFREQVKREIDPEPSVSGASEVIKTSDKIENFDLNEKKPQVAISAASDTREKSQAALAPAEAEKDPLRKPVVKDVKAGMNVLSQSHAKKSLRLPGEFTPDIQSDEKSPDLEQKKPCDSEVKKMDGKLPGLLEENCNIIKNKIKSVFKIDDIEVELGEDSKKVNITISNLDVSAIKHFLNLMSLQSKYYRFMSGILKEDGAAADVK